MFDELPVFLQHRRIAVTLGVPHRTPPEHGGLASFTDGV